MINVHRTHTVGSEDHLTILQVSQVEGLLSFTLLPAVFRVNNNENCEIIITLLLIKVKPFRDAAMLFTLADVTGLKI